MNLKYIDYFKSDYKNYIKKIYTDSFPKSERFPFWILEKCAKEGNIKFNIVLDNDKAVGMEYLINYDNISYLMYLAVDNNERNKGYGSKILKDLINKNEVVILCIERPKEQLKYSKNRKDFYLRNNFYETNKFIVDSKVEYEVLCSKKDYEITEKILQNRYDKMSNSKVMKFIIKMLFENNTKFIK